MTSSAVDKNKVRRTIRDVAHRVEPLDATIAAAAMVHVLAGAILKTRGDDGSLNTTLEIYIAALR